jgi:curved DNA-binding protein CbpA
MDYYELLAVSRNATETEIRTAYRRLAQNLHPDHSGDMDAVDFRKVQEAYETLSDPARRTAYNRKLESEIPIRIVSRPATEAVYEVHRHPQGTRRSVQEAQRRHRFARSVWGEFERLTDEFFNF